MLTEAKRKQIQDNGILLSLTGEISQQLLALNIQHFKNKIDTLKETSANAHNLFPVFIEMVQNIVNYSQSICSQTQTTSIENLISQSSILILGFDRLKAKFYIETSNLILKRSQENIQERIDYINRLSANTVKSYYKKMRKEGENKHQKGAGLGFIYMAKLSSDKLVYQFDQFDEQYNYFMLKVYI